jgi:hypothetical protein
MVKLSKKRKGKGKVKTNSYFKTKNKNTKTKNTKTKNTKTKNTKNKNTKTKNTKTKNTKTKNTKTTKKRKRKHKNNLKIMKGGETPKFEVLVAEYGVKESEKVSIPINQTDTNRLGCGFLCDAKFYGETLNLLNTESKKSANFDTTKLSLLTLNYNEKP